MTKKVKLRTLLIGGLFTLFFVAIMGRLYWVQVVQSSALLERAKNMWENDRVLQPVRGAIVDRNLQVLAEDGPSYTVIVNPQIIRKLGNSAEIVRVLSEILKKPQNELQQLVTKQREDGKLLSWVEVRSEGWKIDAETADQIAEELGLAKPITSRRNLYTHGVLLEETVKRYYPAKSLAAHVLGYFDKNGKAVMGLEAKYDEVLRGKPGRIVYTRDNLGYELPDANVTYEPAVDGKKLQLTLDRNIQSYIEAALERAYAEWKPKSMSAIAMNPKTGEILGIANLPTFDPNTYWEAKTDSFYNHAVGSQYEPGSTFKLVTLAAAVEEGLFNPDETFQSGTIRVTNRTLHDHDYWRNWGEMTYLEGLKRSSNVAFVKLGLEKLGQEKLTQYIKTFGFGEKTGIDIPGEASGIIRLRYPVDYATTTYGQGGITATAIQQIAAYASIANGGIMMQPHIVKAILDPKTDEPLQTFEPQTVRRTVSEQTAKKVTEYLEQVVSDREIGTGRNAYIEGYRVAGKTGTANKVIDGKYAEDKWLITFIGYAPVEDPQIVVLVMADEPDLGGDYRLGGQVTGPVFREIVSQSLRYMGVSATVKQELSGMELVLHVPDLSNLSVEQAEKKLAADKMRYEKLGNGKTVIAQIPAPGTEISPQQRIYILTEPMEDLELPDLTGKSLRDAMVICSFLDFDCKVTGEGYVFEQKTSVSEGKKTAELTLKPPYAAQNADKAQAGKESKGR
jgi:penicillin-binding protein 2B